MSQAAANAIEADATTHAPTPYTAEDLAELFPPRKVPTRPVVIPPLPEAPKVHPTLEALAADLAARLAGRRAVLTPGFGTYIGYATFPLLSVYAEGERGDNGGPPVAVYLCAAAVQDTPREVLAAAIAEAQARLAPQEQAA